MPLYTVYCCIGVKRLACWRLWLTPDLLLPCKRPPIKEHPDQIDRYKPWACVLERCPPPFPHTGALTHSPGAVDPYLRQTLPPNKS